MSTYKKLVDTPEVVPPADTNFFTPVYSVEDMEVYNFPKESVKEKIVFHFCLVVFVVLTTGFILLTVQNFVTAFLKYDVIPEHEVTLAGFFFMLTLAAVAVSGMIAILYTIVFVGEIVGKTRFRKMININLEVFAQFINRTTEGQWVEDAEKTFSLMRDATMNHVTDVFTVNGKPAYMFRSAQSANWYHIVFGTPTELKYKTRYFDTIPKPDEVSGLAVKKYQTLFRKFYALHKTPLTVLEDRALVKIYEDFTFLHNELVQYISIGGNGDDQWYGEQLNNLINRLTIIEGNRLTNSLQSTKSEYESVS